MKSLRKTTKYCLLLFALRHLTDKMMNFGLNLVMNEVLLGEHGGENTKTK